MSEQRQPVAVAVAAHMVKKPDRTGLPDTIGNTISGDELKRKMAMMDMEVVLRIVQGYG